MRRLAAALLAVMAVAGCDSTGGDSTEADRAATCEPPELWWADERAENDDRYAPSEDTSHCAYLSVCLIVAGDCDGNIEECVKECTEATFGDSACGCCGDLECESSCGDVQDVVLRLHTCDAERCDQMDDLVHECGEIGQPLR